MEAGARTTRTRAKPPRRILLVDCDAFFVQVARLEDPAGAGRAPLLIVGGSARHRGVVTSASYEARRFGVRSAMPTAEALRLCPRATLVPVPRHACSRKSRAILQALEGFSPVVERASIDEFFVDLTGTERLFDGESLEETAWRILARVKEETAIQVSAGGGTTRLVAKLAADRAKPAGVHVVPPGGEAAFMRSLRLSDIPGVGPALAAELARRGLVGVEDALRAGDAWLARWLGPERGAWLARRIRGEDASPVSPGEPRRSMSSERTYGRDLADDRVVERELLRLSRTVAASLRGEALAARTVTVKVRDPDRTTRQASRTLTDPVESDTAVFAVARELLAALRARRRAPVRLLGVGLSGLAEGTPHGTAAAPGQLGLFGVEGPESERDRKLSRVRDELRARLGSEGILPATLLEGADQADGEE